MMGEGNFGIASYVRGLTHALAQIDKENKYTVLVNNAVLSGSITADNFSFLRTNIKWMSLQEQWQLPRLLKSLKPDLFHATSFVVPLWHKGRTVITIHDLIHAVFPQYYGLLQKIYYDFILKNALKRACAIIADSGSTKNDLVSYFGIKADQIRVIHLAASDQFKLLSDVNKKAADLPDKFILYVGSRKKYKNLSGLFEAFGQFKLNDQQGYHLVISGEIDLETKVLAERSGIKDWLVYAGRREGSALVNAYNAASLFVFPSLYEGFGLPPLEAMACGTPVITSNVSSLPEVVGQAAILVDPNNIQELAGAMNKVLNDPTLAADLRQKVLARAHEFSWGKCARETLEVYRSAAR
jgi:glycosyltransferase involved in cell wall biosynthesis